VQQVASAVCFRFHEVWCLWTLDALCFGPLMMVWSCLSAAQEKDEAARGVWIASSMGPLDPEIVCDLDHW
jgi:hypothetical protein